MGDNLTKRVDPKLCSWYKGPSFFELLGTLFLNLTLLTDFPFVR